MRDLDLYALEVYECAGFYSTYHKSCPTFDVRFLIGSVLGRNMDVFEWNSETGWSCSPPTQLLLPRELL